MTSHFDPRKDYGAVEKDLDAQADRLTALRELREHVLHAAPQKLLDWAERLRSKDPDLAKDVEAYALYLRRLAEETR